MRAFAVDRFGDEGSLRELPDPVPGPGELLVRVTVAGVNPVDWKIRDGGHGERTFPLVLGADFAGIVYQVGSGVRDVQTGDRVFGIARTHGSYADLTVVPASSPSEPIAPIPPWLSDAEAAALPIAGLTALAALRSLDVGVGEPLLILGATGGVGAFAAQIAHGRGIHVIATARSGKEAFARSLGADEVIAYDCEDVVAAVQSAHLRGVAAVLDLVSDREAIKRIADVIRPGGRIASAIRSVDEAWFASRGIAGTNISLNQSPESSAAGLDELLRLLKSRTVVVHLQATRTLADAAAILGAFKGGALSGKVVLEVEAA